MSSDNDKNNNDINHKSDESTKLNIRESSNGLFHRNSRPYIYAELSKYRLSALVVVTSGAGFLCAGAPIDLTAMAAVTSGTALCAASAGTFNQVIEKRHDIKMLRTRLRPLPSGRISSAEATAWGVSSGLAGTALLYTATNPVVAALGAANIFIYAVPYTLSKQHTEWNTWIGSLVGALPPLMGYAAATGGDITGPTPIALASLLFLWQFPHFFALSWLHREDYARGGFQMVAVNDPIGARSAGFIWEYSLYLSALPIITCATGLTSWMFAVEGTIANLYLLSLAHAFKQEQSNAKARAVFLCSLWYLPLLLGGYIFHSKVWNESLHTDDMVRFYIFIHIYVYM
jgi:protoheme IX farnesyltransferase